MLLLKNKNQDSFHNKLNKVIILQPKTLQLPQYCDTQSMSHLLNSSWSRFKSPGVFYIKPNRSSSNSRMIREVQVSAPNLNSFFFCTFKLVREWSLIVMVITPSRGIFTYFSWRQEWFTSPALFTVRIKTWFF